MADSQRKTANLFDDETASGYYNDSGVLVSDLTASHSTTYIPVNGTTYTVSGLWYRADQMANFAVYEWDNNKNWLRRSNRQYPPSSNEITFAIGTDTAYITLQLQTEHGNIMLNVGSTPLPYEPYGWLHSLRKLTTATDTITSLPAVLYPNDTTATVGISGNMEQIGAPTPQNPIQPSECGDLETIGEKAGQYKIPISSANTTTPVYLGEVETTRKIKKLVLTGTETYIKESNATYLYYIYVPHMYHTNCLCSHLKSTTGYPTKQEGCSTYNNASIIYLNFGSTVMDAQTSGNTVAGLKEYLAAQYSAGTPVTIWYVLATETTGIVNEPLRKIGDYADTVSGITIPTVTGKDTFDVLTTLKPSEVSLAYTGWHGATVKERDGSEWQ